MKGLKIVGTLVTIGGCLLSFVGKIIDDKKQEELIGNEVTKQVAAALKKD